MGVWTAGKCSRVLLSGHKCAFENQEFLQDFADAKCGFNVSIEEGCKNNSKIPCDSTFYYVTYVAEQKSKSN